MPLRTRRSSAACAAWFAALALVAPGPSALAAVRMETIRFKSDTVTFVGTLALPERAGAPLPAVVLLHGSERGRRDNPFFQVVRDRLTAAGWAVLSYDRRGVGESGGTYVETPDLSIPAGDAISAVRFLAGRSEIDPEHIGLMGTSQGGWVAPLAATMAPGIAFVVAVSEPGVSPFEQSTYQRASELVEAGLDRAQADSVTALRRVLYHYWHGEVSRAAAESAWAASHGHAWHDRAAETDELFSRIGRLSSVPPPSRMPDDFMRAVREHFFYDPIPVAERLRIPILHLFGAADRHVPIDESVVAFRAAYARSGNREAVIRVLPNAGHSMQWVQGGAECLRCPAERGAFTPAPGWMDTLVAWLRTVAPGSR
jgi:uncharacterized protein